MPPADLATLRRLLAPVRAIVYDFDGVVLESADVKTRAFVEMFEDRPEHLEAIRRHHLANLGISRFEKFRWILRELFHEEPTEERLQELGRRFAERIRAAVAACPFVPGARASIERARSSGRSTWVASGTPHEELVEVVGVRGLVGLFDDVQGSPTSKGEILRGILADLALAPEEMLMIGDGTTDQRAADEVGCRFLARSTPDHHDHWVASGAVWVPDLRPLAEALEPVRAGSVASR